MRNLFVMLLILSSLGCEKDIIISKPGYTIGIIYQYVPGYVGGPSSVRFDYEVNTKKLHNGYGNGQNGWQVPVDAGYKSGDKFMVQYDLDDVNIARMLFNYSVKDSTDYTRYIEEFKTNPPK